MDQEKNVIKKKLKPKYLCMSGAGIFGISFLGALSLIDLSDVSVICGSSAGGVIAGLMGIGFTSEEIYKIVYTLNLGDFQNISIDNLLTRFGLDNMTKIHQFFVALMMEKKINAGITLLELYKKTKKTIIITGSCLNTGEVEYFSWKTTPNMPLITAMKITMTFIGIFTPIVYNDSHYCDGALFDFFPMNHILREYKVTQKDYVFGLSMKTSSYRIDKINGFGEYMYALYSGLTKNYCDYMTYTDNKRLNISSNDYLCDYSSKSNNTNENANNNTNKNANTNKKSENKNNTSVTDSDSDTETKYDGHIIYIYNDPQTSSNSMNLGVSNEIKKEIYEKGRDYLLKYLLNPFV